ncbi:MAG TPA: enoyl-CoA hydratase-related protein [Actinomycetota bacterium]
MSERVSFEPGPVARVTMNRPGARNALDAQMREALAAALGRAAADPGCRVVVLAAAGEDFSSGADLDELGAARADGGVGYVGAFDELCAAVEQQPQPVIAEVRGGALGAGCLLVASCDLAVAAEDARFGIPSGRLGVVLTYEGVERLVLSVGPKRAAELLEAGAEIDGTRAAEWGLVNRAVPAEDLRHATDALARHVAARAPLSVKGSKRGIRAALENLSLDRSTAGHRVADFDMMAAEAFGSRDLAEGIAAYRERRRPQFEGR